MFDLTEAYDDLVALRRTLDVSRGMISRTSCGELNALLKLTEGRVYVALHALDHGEREDSIEALDKLYEGDARRDLAGI